MGVFPTAGVRGHNAEAEPGAGLTVAWPNGEMKHVGRPLPSCVGVFQEIQAALTQERTRREELGWEPARWVLTPSLLPDLSGARIGLFSIYTGINVRSFKGLSL